NGQAVPAWSRPPGRTAVPRSAARRPSCRELQGDDRRRQGGINIIAAEDRPDRGEELATILLPEPPFADGPPLLAQKLRGDARALLGGDAHPLPRLRGMPGVVEPAAAAERR